MGDVLTPKTLPPVTPLIQIKLMFFGHYTTNKSYKRTELRFDLFDLLSILSIETSMIRIK